jgi:hypothetical protein
MELKFEDLIRLCDRCSGEGMLSESGLPASEMSVDSTSNLGVCPKCKGRGGATTPTGEAIRQFLLHLRRRGEL